MAVQDRLAVQVGLGAGSEGTAGGAGALCGYEATVVWGRGTADWFMRRAPVGFSRGPVW